MCLREGGEGRGGEGRGGEGRGGGGKGRVGTGEEDGRGGGGQAETVTVVLDIDICLTEPEQIHNSTVSTHLDSKMGMGTLDSLTVGTQSS